MTRILDVLSRATGGADGPVGWPLECREYLDERSAPPPPEGVERMTLDAYRAETARRQPEYDAWARAAGLPQARATALARLAEYRWLRESEGVRVGDMLIETDREARGSLTSAVVLAQMALMQGQPFSVAWKTREGFRDLDAAALIEAGQAAAVHVAGCFAREQAIAEQIERMTDPDALDALDMHIVWATGAAR